MSKSRTKLKEILRSQKDNDEEKVESRDPVDDNKNEKYAQNRSETVQTLKDSRTSNEIEKNRAINEEGGNQANDKQKHSLTMPLSQKTRIQFCNSLSRNK